MLGQEFKNLYEGYYDGSVNEKRAISARDSMREIARVSQGQRFKSLLDVGSGDGAVLSEMERSGFAEKLTAVEISESGIAAIQQRNLKSLTEVQPFDGYKIPFADNTFDVAVSTYVLEHVEHERLFLKEMARVADRIIVSIPLENTMRIKNSLKRAKSIGHINFYTFETFNNVLETSGLKVEKSFVYATSLEYEQYCSRRFGRLKYMTRSTTLGLNQSLACRLFCYMAIAMCRKA